MSKQPARSSLFRFDTFRPKKCPMNMRNEIMSFFSIKVFVEPYHFLHAILKSCVHCTELVPATWNFYFCLC